jgi:hypothetical protein
VERKGQVQVEGQEQAWIEGKGQALEDTDRHRKKDRERQG